MNNEYVVKIKALNEEFTLFFLTVRSARMHARKIQKLLNGRPETELVDIGNTNIISVKRKDVSWIFVTVEDREDE